MSVRIPRDSKVLILEDSCERRYWFDEKLIDVKIVDVVRTAADAIALLNGFEYDFIFLDHDLGLLDSEGRPGKCGDGLEVAKYLAEHGSSGNNIVIHSHNPTGAGSMNACLKDAVKIPFGQFNIDVI